MINNSREYYKVLFPTVLMLLEEELVFKKFAPLKNLQKASDIRVSNDKLKSATTEEIGRLLCEVITSTITAYCKES